MRDLSKITKVVKCHQGLEPRSVWVQTSRSWVASFNEYFTNFDNYVLVSVLDSEDKREGKKKKIYLPFLYSGWDLVKKKKERKKSWNEWSWSLRTSLLYFSIPVTPLSVFSPTFGNLMLPKAPPLQNSPESTLRLHLSLLKGTHTTYPYFSPNNWLSARKKGFLK